MTRAERQQMREYFSARRAEERDFARGVALACRARGLAAETDAQTRPEWTGKRKETGTEMAESKSTGEGQGAVTLPAGPFRIPGRGGTFRRGWLRITKDSIALYRVPEEPGKEAVPVLVFENNPDTRLMFKRCDELAYALEVSRG